MSFINLHTHTTYSLMNSTIKVNDLFNKVKELGQPAVAITDHGSCGAAYDALKASKETGIKLIIGQEFYFVDDVADLEARFRHVILLAKNAIGYKNLLTISKLGYDNGTVTFKKMYPRIDWKIIEKFSEGLICTTACAGGILGQLINGKKFDEAEQNAIKLKNIFEDNFAIEIQPNAMVRNENAYSYKIDQVFTNRKLIELAKRLDIRIIATTNAHYLTKDQSKAHDVLLAINSGQPIESGNRLKYSVPDFYVKSEDEVFNFFDKPLYKAVGGEGIAKEIIDNTLYFSNMCEESDWIDPKFSNPSGKELPIFPIKDQKDYNEFQIWLNNQLDEIKNLDEDKSYLRYCCEMNFDSRIQSSDKDQYRERLKEELDVIEYHSFSSYMLIVADYIDFAVKNNIRVGVGRGSIGGSLIGYLLNIHQADPIKYKLIFARFHNKDKVAYPDIDSDFSPIGRDRVQEYIRNKYGKDFVAHVSNINTITPKVYARDIARTFEFGGDRKKAVAIGTNIADSIPIEVKTVKSALNSVPLFQEFAKCYSELAEFADTVAGKARAHSTHAAGLVISRRPLVGLIPLRKDKDGAVAIEYEKDRAESNGLVKMDTLGLETLDIIDLTYQLIKEAGKPIPLDPPNYDVYDKKTYDLISKGDTFCVFQLGSSGGTIDLCRKVKPKSIEDLAIITTLARPAAKDIRENFIKVRDGDEQFELLHPLLERAFKDTLGFGLYEECLMYLAQDFAGWDMNRADRLRKLTKDKGKHPEKIAQWKEEFINDAQINKGVSEKIARKVWEEVISKFGGYAFNISHAILYSMISYHTAYLKAHFPIEFLTANLMSEVKSNAKQAKDNIIKIKDEIRNLKVKIIAPNINTSNLTYKLMSNGELMTGLDALKNIGNDAIPEILAKRPFESFEDFLSKIDGRKVRAPAVQALAASGCLDMYGMSRKLMFLYASDYKKKMQVWLKKPKDKRGEFKYPFPTDVGEWTIPELYSLEKYYLGEGLSGTLKDRFPNFFNCKMLAFASIPILYPHQPDDSEKKKFGDKPFINELRGEVRSQFKFKIKKEGSKLLGRIMQRVVLRDYQGTELTIVLFPDTLDKVEDQLRQLSGKKTELEPGMAIKFSGFVSYYEGELSVILDDIYDFKLIPLLPDDLSSKKISIPRVSKNKKDELEEQSQEELLEELENDFIDDGIYIEEDE